MPGARHACLQNKRPVLAHWIVASACLPHAHVMLQRHQTQKQAWKANKSKLQTTCNTGSLDPRARTVDDTAPRDFPQLRILAELEFA